MRLKKEENLSQTTINPQSVPSTSLNFILITLRVTEEIKRNKRKILNHQKKLKIFRAIITHLSHNALSFRQKFVCFKADKNSLNLIIKE